jgi:hypothetical protein
MDMMSETLVLEYKSAKPSLERPVAYWTGNVGGHEKKLVRVLAGVAVPQLDRQAGAVVVVGEIYRAWAPMDLTGLAAAVGSWSFVKTALVQFCRDLKFDHIITDSQESREILWRIQGLENGLREAPALTCEAPKYALTEVGRQNVRALIDEERLHIEHLLPVLDQEKDQADKALRCAVNWALEFTAFYGSPGRGPLDPKLFGREGL